MYEIYIYIYKSQSDKVKEIKKIKKKSKLYKYQIIMNRV